MTNELQTKAHTDAIEKQVRLVREAYASPAQPGRTADILQHEKMLGRLIVKALDLGLTIKLSDTKA